MINSDLISRADIERIERMPIPTGLVIFGKPGVTAQTRLMHYVDHVNRKLGLFDIEDRRARLREFYRRDNRPSLTEIVHYLRDVGVRAFREAV